MTLKLQCLLKLRLLLYADDIMILAETPSDLQIMGCINLKLFINFAKSQVMTFSSGKIRNEKQFYLKETELG